MLFADDPDRYAVPYRVDNMNSELALGLEDALSVVPQGSVAEVRMELLGSVEPLVNLEVVLGVAAEATG